jgi:hypothetical protein
MADDKFKALTLYWSETGNTRLVARALHRTLRDLDLDCELAEIRAELDVDFEQYNLVMLGAPVHQWLPPEPVVRWLKWELRRRSHIYSAAPEQVGRYGVVFTTYSGRHTGTSEALPALKYMGQFLEHAGRRVMEEWAVVGCFHDPALHDHNIDGRLGDIRNRPDQRDLSEICERLKGLLRRLHNKLPPLPGV